MLTAEPIARQKSLLRWRWVMVAALLGLLAAPVFYHAFCQWPRHSATWIEGRLDESIERGLSYLHGSYAFLRPLERGGAPALHHHLLNQVIQKHDHAGLRVHLELAARLNQDAGEWRDFYGTPGWINEELTPEDHERIQLFTQNSRAPNDALLLHALHPAWTDLSAENRNVLFEAPERLTDSSELARLLLAYHWLQETSPATATKRRVDELASRVNERLRKLQARAWRCDTAYCQRVASWLLVKRSEPMSRRYVERILLNQSANGGWPAAPTRLRTLFEMFGCRVGSEEDSVETTLYALVALSQFRAASPEEVK